VTNGEFLEFVTSGNYDNPQYWRPEDWIWKEKERMNHPVFWRRDETGAYKVRMTSMLLRPILTRNYR